MQEAAIKPCAAATVASPQVASSRQLHGESMTFVHEELSGRQEGRTHGEGAADVDSADIKLHESVEHQSKSGSSIPSGVMHFAAGAMSSFLLSFGIIRAMSGVSGSSVFTAGHSLSELTAARTEVLLLAEKVAQLADKSLAMGAAAAAPHAPATHAAQDPFHMWSVVAIVLVIVALFSFLAVHGNASINNTNLKDSPNLSLKDLASAMGCEKTNALERKLDLLLEGLRELHPQQHIKGTNDEILAQGTESELHSSEEACSSEIVQPIDLTWKIEACQSQERARMLFSHRVEWDVSGKDFTSFKWGEFLESSEFRLSMDHGLRLRFIPRGGAADGCCRLALVAPRRLLSEVRCRLYVNKQSAMGCPAECGETTYIWAQIPADQNQLYSVLAVELLKPEGFTTL